MLPYLMDFFHVMYFSSFSTFIRLRITKKMKIKTKSKSFGHKKSITFAIVFLFKKTNGVNTFRLNLNLNNNKKYLEMLWLSKRNISVVQEHWNLNVYSTNSLHMNKHSMYVGIMFAKLYLHGCEMKLLYTCTYTPIWNNKKKHSDYIFTNKARVDFVLWNIYLLKIVQYFQKKNIIFFVTNIEHKQNSEQTFWYLWL